MNANTACYMGPCHSVTNYQNKVRMRHHRIITFEKFWKEREMQFLVLQRLKLKLLPTLVLSQMWVIPIRIHCVDYIFCFFAAFACVGMKLGWLWRRFFVGFTDTITPWLHGKKITLAHQESVIQSSAFPSEINSLGAASSQANCQAGAYDWRSINVVK